MRDQIAIVTGANGGLGKEFVKLLAAQPEITEIWTIARDREKLEQSALELGARVRIFSMDLTDRENVKHLAAELEKSGAAVKYLINNAGFAKFCSYDDISIEESLNMIDLNVGAVVALGLACIPHMERGSHLINIASQASFFPLPYQNIYSSTKAFVRNYTRALNVELKEKGIGATAVCPGWMKTGLFDRGLIGAKKGTRNFSGMVTPDLVAKKALRDAEKGKDISVYGSYVKFTHLLSKITPQRLMMKIWLGQQGIRLQKDA
ncbi:SDR family NAD(P)-dependent oxidoreductase [Anaerofilum sp. BX8]|uniref:SDR family NAD(P)-dependent oxidoreductase n=1 Tax=Anaerofilum hominis TaxID=2763016 RepID=A0A923IEB4_9FIRM|nr:SDR family NAD(P)-dependent oxidoreductase [Anaerofilum hominis]MBC5580952.1 SDR family NAD(P)-dependent oxidoreductase [Anaerofilum hominis]